MLKQKLTSLLNERKNLSMAYWPVPGWTVRPSSKELNMTTSVPEDRFLSFTTIPEGPGDLLLRAVAYAGFGVADLHSQLYNLYPKTPGKTMHPAHVLLSSLGGHLYTLRHTLSDAAPSGIPRPPFCTDWSQSAFSLCSYALEAFHRYASGDYPESMKADLRRLIRYTGELLEAVGDGPTVVERARTHLHYLILALSDYEKKWYKTETTPWYTSLHYLEQAAYYDTLRRGQRLHLLSRMADSLQAEDVLNQTQASELASIIDLLEKIRHALGESGSSGHRLLDQLDARRQGAYIPFRL